MIHTHQTAPTQFVEANGIRFAYRRFGKASGVPSCELSIGCPSGPGREKLKVSKPRQSRRTG